MHHSEGILLIIMTFIKGVDPRNETMNFYRKGLRRLIKSIKRTGYPKAPMYPPFDLFGMVTAFTRKSPQ